MKFACLSSETRTGMSSLALLAHGLPSFLESVQGEGSLTPRGLPQLAELVDFQIPPGRCQELIQ